MKEKRRLRFITQSAIIAAAYVVLTYVANAFGLASRDIQCRLSESLLVLPMFSPAAIPGLFVGCFLSNLLTGCFVADIVFGSIATLIGAVGAYLLRNRHPVISTSVNVIANTVIVPFVLRYAYGLDGAMWYFFVTVGIGEIISCTVLGTLLFGAVKKHEKVLFGRLKNR